MGGLSKITESILGEAQSEAKKILDAASAEEREILAKCEEDKAKITEDEAKKLQEECMELSRLAETAADAEAREIILSAKNKAIEKITEYLKESLKNADKEEYFEFLAKLCKGNRESGDGVMYLSKEDLARMPADFEKRVNEGLTSGKITISAEPTNTNGGFIIKYGKVDINCTLDSIFEEKKNDISDIINKSLMKE